MAAPQTNGVLRTTLESMNIGDYIKCEYSQTNQFLGAFTAVFLGNSKNITTELDLMPRVVGYSAAGFSGFFYLIKVATGLLIADRSIVTNLSAQTLNGKNYLLGAKLSNNCMLRCLSRAEFLKYISNSDLNGNIIKADANVWHGQAGTSSTIVPTGTTYIEINQDRTGDKIETSFFMNGTTIDSISHGYLRSALNLLPILASYTAVYNLAYTSGGTYYSYLSFRPALEYIDNPKSTNLYY